MIDRSYGVVEGKNDMASKAKYDWPLVNYDRPITKLKIRNLVEHRKNSNGSLRSETPLNRDAKFHDFSIRKIISEVSWNFINEVSISFKPVLKKLSKIAVCWRSNTLYRFDLRSFMILKNDQLNSLKFHWSFMKFHSLVSFMKFHKNTVTKLRIPTADRQPQCVPAAITSV